MLTRQLPLHALPTLQLQNKVCEALRLMNENRVTHLPITDGEKYIGLISENDLLPTNNDQATLDMLEQSFSTLSVKEDDHFLKAVQMAAEYGLSIIPVVNDENELLGTITCIDLLRYASEFMSLQEPGGLIVLEIPSNQYSFTEICKLVETNDAQITQLNTSNNAKNGMMQVTIRINKPEISDILATFQRYEYDVKYFLGEEIYANELRTNYENLMHYLNI